MDIDITQDLTDGSDGGLADTIPANGADAVPQNQGDAVRNAPADSVPADQVQPKPKEDEFNLRDQLSSAFKGTEEAGEPATPAEVVALTKDEAGKYRRPDGTFANADQITTFEAAQAAPVEGAEPKPFDTVLQSLTAVEQSQFQALPAELQQYVGRTMEAMNSRATRYTEYDQLEQQLIGPRRQAWAQNGMNPVVAVNQLLALSDFATQSPKDFVLWFAEQNGVDIDEALDEREAMASGDPMVQQLQGTVQSLQQQLQQYQVGQQNEVQQANYSAVENFAQEKDEGGSLKRPYLTEVMDDWATHISALRTANPTMPNDVLLQKSYESACWSNANVRARMQTDVDAQRKAQAAQRTQQARNAASSITGGPSGRPASGQVPGNSNLSLRDELAQQFAAAQS